MITFLTGVFTGDWKKAFTGLKTYVKGVFDHIGSIVKIPFNLITNALKTLKLNWMLGWTTIKNWFAKIWEKIGEYAKAPLKIVLGMVKTVLEGIESMINAVVDAVNTLSFDIPDYVPGFGGTHFGFDLNHLSISAKIPELAKGTVVPANYGEFLAVLGDNKREAEVVSPYSTMIISAEVSFTIPEEDIRPGMVLTSQANITVAADVGEGVEGRHLRPARG